MVGAYLARLDNYPQKISERSGYDLKSEIDLLWGDFQKDVYYLPYSVAFLQTVKNNDSLWRTVFIRFYLTSIQYELYQYVIKLRFFFALARRLLSF